MSSSSEMELSESTESALIESMEMQIDQMHDEMQKTTWNNQQTQQKGEMPLYIT